MRYDPLVQEIVRLTRDLNEPDHERRVNRDPDATLLARLKAAQAAYARTHVVIDREEALQELRSDGDVTPELRFALARQIVERQDEQIPRKTSFKRGSKREGVVPEPRAVARRPAVAKRDVLAVLLTFGSTTHPIGIGRDARGVLIDILTRARKLKKSPGIAGDDADKVRGVVATVDAEARHAAGMPKEAAISAAVEATHVERNEKVINPAVKRATVRRHLYLRDRRRRRRVSR